MREDQSALLKTTSDKVHLFSWKRVLINTLFFVPFVIIIFLVASIEITLLIVVFTFVASFLYTFAKEWMMDKRTKKLVVSQYEYLKAQKPNLDFYIPILDLLGKRVYLKPSALFSEDDTLTLAAYKQIAYSVKPVDVIFVPEGKGLLIHEKTKVMNDELIEYRGLLLDNEYRFYVLNDALIEAIIDSKMTQRKEQNVNTPQ